MNTINMLMQACYVYWAIYLYVNICSLMQKWHILWRQQLQTIKVICWSLQQPVYRSIRFNSRKDSFGLEIVRTLKNCMLFIYKRGNYNALTFQKFIFFKKNIHISLPQYNLDYVLHLTIYFFDSTNCQFLFFCSFQIHILLVSNKCEKYHCSIVSLVFF